MTWQPVWRPVWRRLAGAGLALILVTAALLAVPPATVTAVTAPGSADLPEGRRFTASDGAVLALHIWPPEGQPRLLLVAAHGMNDYGQSFERPARLWASQGIATYALDQRGFGQSLAHGRWYGGERMADDLIELARRLGAEHPGTPVFLLGESMGGAVAVLAASRAAPGLFAGLVLSAPAIWGDGPGAGLTYAAARLTGTVAPWVTVPPLDHTNLSTDDPAVWTRLRSDPLVIHRTRFDTLAGIVALMRTAKGAAAAVHLPALVMLGDRDGHVPRDGVAALLARLPGGARPALYPGGRHLLMRSLNGDAVSRDVAAWLTDPAAPLPSGADRRGQACGFLILHPEEPCPQDQPAPAP